MFLATHSYLSINSYPLEGENYVCVNTVSAFYPISAVVLKS